MNKDIMRLLQIICDVITDGDDVDFEELNEIADRNNLIIDEDCCVLRKGIKEESESV